MAAAEEHDIEHKASAVEHSSETASPPVYEGAALGQTNTLKRNLMGRHMQMIAIGQYALRTGCMTGKQLETDNVDTGGAIGAGLFVGTGSALHSGGPGALVRTVSDSNSKVHT